ncbi:hypothetical protein J3F84DRAFT_373239 [Trichoderma pleuroticola]
MLIMVNFQHLSPVSISLLLVNSVQSRESHQRVESRHHFPTAPYTGSQVKSFPITCYYSLFRNHDVHQALSSIVRIQSSSTIRH